VGATEFVIARRNASVILATVLNVGVETSHLPRRKQGASEEPDEAAGYREGDIERIDHARPPIMVSNVSTIMVNPYG
jgi:hypothetical protein